MVRFKQNSCKTIYETINSLSKKKEANANPYKIQTKPHLHQCHSRFRYLIPVLSLIFKWVYRIGKRELRLISMRALWNADAQQRHASLL